MVDAEAVLVDVAVVEAAADPLGVALAIAADEIADVEPDADTDADTDAEPAGGTSPGSPLGSSPTDGSSSLTVDLAFFGSFAATARSPTAFAPLACAGSQTNWYAANAPPTSNKEIAAASNKRGVVDRFGGGTDGTASGSALTIGSALTLP